MGLNVSQQTLRPLIGRLECRPRATQIAVKSLRCAHDQSKGKEFKYVFVIGVGNRQVPLDFRKKMFYVPHGFAHGFLTLTAYAEFEYKCTDYYDPSDEHCLFWDDKNININLPFKKEDIIVSEKDSKGLLLNELISQGII